MASQNTYLEPQVLQPLTSWFISCTHVKPFMKPAWRGVVLCNEWEVLRSCTEGGQLEGQKLGAQLPSASKAPLFCCRNPPLEQPIFFKYCPVGLELVLVCEKLLLLFEKPRSKEIF